MDSLTAYLPTSIKGKRILITGGTTDDAKAFCLYIQSVNLDILINNAALPYESIMEGSYPDWQYIINTNLLGYMACCNEALERMEENTSSHIVNIGSISADQRGKDSSVYVATKAGIQGFNEFLRKEINELGIKVSLIEPGLVGSGRVEEGRQEQRCLSQP